MLEYKIGYGYDVHRLKAGRELILGGVKITHPTGLDGHSDGDVLAHAMMDAMLGAAALGDIGAHFPDTDPTYRGADSLELMRKVGALIRQKGYSVGNIDATIGAQKPKLLLHIPKMIENIARVLEISPNQINIKATTTEGLGFVGREEGMDTHAVCILKKTP